MIQTIISNTINPSKLQKPYSAMIGLEPSKGARSPLLWNSCLRDSSSMICFDIPNVKSLSKVYQFLVSDQNCLGGAVTAPYKESFFKLCEESTSYASALQLTNNFYRSSTSSLFVADNTDSQGFISAIDKVFQLEKFDLALILGYGSVAKIVHSALLGSDKFSGDIHILSRRTPSLKVRQTFMSTYSSFLDSLPLPYKSVLLINCTSIGDYTNPDQSLLEHIPQLSTIISKTSISAFYDCIHTPSNTHLSNYLEDVDKSNGLLMNIYQAVIGFRNVYPAYSHQYVFATMSSL